MEHSVSPAALRDPQAIGDAAQRRDKARARLGQLITGAMIPDVVPTFGSLNMIGGECDH